MGGISLIVFFEYNVLFVFVVLNDFIWVSFEFCMELVDKRDDERCYDWEDELGELIFELFDDFGKNWDFFEGSGDICEVYC